MDSDSLKRIVNHTFVLQLLTKGTEQLHRIFRERWDILCTINLDFTEWKNDELSGKELIKLCNSVQSNKKGKVFTLDQSIFKKFKEGKIDFWDITVSNSAIQVVSAAICNLGISTNKKEDKLISDLRVVRNDVVHEKDSKLTEAQFVKYWDRVERVVLGLGCDIAEVEKVKTMEIGQTKTAEKESEFENLKVKANKLFQDKKYKEAIEVYDKILNLSDLLPDSQATIFSNRSASYLLLNTSDSIAMAKRDAEWAIQLWPCWWRGYFRLGKVHKRLEEWREAEKAFTHAMALNSSSNEASNELSDVRRRIGILARSEHLNPAQQPKSKEEQMHELFQRTGMSKAQSAKFNDMAMKVPKFGYVLKGHQFRDGLGASQDYAQAAKCYAKAAHLGNEEAMYNLGLLHHHGRGVERNDELAMYWLLKAANGNPIGGPRVGTGVPEAQHLLGLKYSEGVGVEKDYSKAAEWYEKAVQNGLCNSANNLGLQYKNGEGVPRSLEKAFYYLKLASKWGDTAAMGNLAHCYFYAEGTEADIAEGMRWLKIAAEKGDLYAAQEFERRQKQTPEETKFDAFKNMLFPGMKAEANPFDQEQYRKTVEEAAKKGSFTALRHLDIWKNMNLAMDAFKKNEPSKVLEFLAKAIRLDFQIVEIPELFKPVIEKMFKIDPKNLNSITCYLRLNSKQPKQMMKLIVSNFLKIYPNDEFLLETLITASISVGQYDAAFEMANNALQMDFLDLIKTKHSLLYSQLPNAFREKFNGINGTQFAILQVLRCTSKNIKVEVSVMKETQKNQIICHRYSHAGTFKADRYETKIIGNILCYQNQICYELDQQQCIGNLNEVNCAISALSRCKCGPESVDSCPVKSIYAAPNFVEVREFEDIVMIATKVKLYPKSLRILYPRAIALCMNASQRPECLQALNDFLSNAPEDHDKVPTCHYRKASYYMVKMDMKNMMKSYEAGLAAEKKQLPCFLPYDCPCKSSMERIQMMMKLNESENIKKCAPSDTVETSSSNVNLQQIKFDPNRKLLLTNHRQMFIQMQESYSEKKKSLVFNTVKNLPNVPKPPRLISLKEITLKEMDATEDKVYDGYVLEARILEWSYLIEGIATIIEDKNGDVERLAVYNWSSTKGDFRKKFDEAIKTFRPNSIISIINPYMRMAQDMRSIIRVQSPEYIRLDYTSEDKKCFICGKEAKVLPCSACLMARYCSKECQKFDWINFNHKEVCEHLKKFSNLVQK